MRTLSPLELNRTLLRRQLLLDRRRRRVVSAVARLVALQAQHAPSPYLALLARIADFRKQQLTRALFDGRVLKTRVVRGTLHVVTRELYPFIEAAQIAALAPRTDRLATDPAALAARWPQEPISRVAAFELAGRLLQTDDRQAIASTIWAMPFVRTAPIGPWPHTKPSPEVLWPEPLAPAHDGVARVVRDYLAGYGPATREDIAQFTGFRRRQIEPALEGLREFADEREQRLVDLQHEPLAGPETKPPVRFLPPYDSIILAHRDRSRILPDRYYETVIRRKNATTLATFTVDGFVAGAWNANRSRGRWKVSTEPFEPPPVRVRREVDAEARRLAAFYQQG